MTQRKTLTFFLTTSPIGLSLWWPVLTRIRLMMEEIPLTINVPDIMVLSHPGG
jgi:hypothetical protein